MFDVNIHCIVFGVNETLNKRCVLSIDDKEIILPHFKLTQNLLDNINENIIKFLNEYVLVNPLELIPQLINIHHNSLKTTDNSLDITYGFVIDYRSNINPSKAYWIDFDPMKETKISLVLFETMQKLS